MKRIIIFAIMLVILSISVSAALNDAELYYDFGVVTNDTIVEGTPIAIDGVYNGSIHFDGSTDYLNLGDNAAWTFSNGGGDDTAFSISMWITPDALTNYQSPISKYAAGQEWYLLTYANGDMAFSLVDSGGDYLLEQTGSGTLTNGGLHHVIVTYDGSETVAGLKFYINATEDTTTTDSSSGVYNGMSDTATPLHIGRRDTLYYDGKLDEVAIYDFELNSSQVTSLFSSGSPSEPANETVTGAIYYNNMDTAFDWSGNSNHAELTTGDNYATGKLESSYHFAGADNVDTNIDLGTTYTIAFWTKPDTYSAAEAYMGIRSSAGSAGERELHFQRLASNDLFLQFYTSGNGNAGTLDGTLTDGSWNHVVLTKTGNNVELFVDGSSVDTDSTSGKHDSGENLVIGQLGEQATQYFNGEMDEIAIYNRVLNGTEISELYNSGTGFNPYSAAAAASTAANILPLTSELIQDSTVTITSTTYQPIINETIEINATTNLTLSATANIYAIQNNVDANCRIILDGENVGSATTSPPRQDYKSIYIKSLMKEKAVGNYTATFECASTSGFNYNVESGTLFTQEYETSNGTKLNVKNVTSSNTISSSSYQLLETENFTTSSTAISAGQNKSVIMKSQLYYTFDSTGTICTIFEVNGINTTDLCRYGSAGDSGSGAKFFVLEDAADSTTYDIKIFAKSTTSDGSLNTSEVFFEIITEDELVNQSQSALAEAGRLDLTNVAISSSSFTTIGTTTVVNDGIADLNLVVESALSIESNSGAAEIDYRVTITGENGTTKKRSFAAASQEGIATMQHEFTGLGTGTHTITLEALADNSNATITGGQLIVYPTAEAVVTSNDYQITAYDHFDNETILVFNVTLGSDNDTFQTTTGVVNIPISIALENLTISASGYSDNTTTNHDTTTNYNASMFDNVLPIITTDLEGNATLVYGDTLTAQINLSDDNLYSLNISDATTGQIYYNNSLGGDTFNYTLNLNLSGYVSGNHTLTVKAADGHTARAIPNYQYENGLGNSIKFIFEDRFLNDDYIRINPEGISGELKVNKLKDRYNFIRHSPDTTTEMVFYVESSHYIDIVDSDRYGYAGHLVVPDLDKWLDFELNQAFKTGNEVYTVTRVSDTMVKVEITNMKNAKVHKFESIGDLNVQETNYTFTIVNATVSYVDPILEGQKTNISIAIDKGRSDVNTSASLLLNGSTVSLSSVSSGNVDTYYYQNTWSITEGALEEDYEFNFTFQANSTATQIENTTTTENFTVIELALLDCSSSATNDTTINFTFQDEDTFSNLNIDGDIQVTYNSSLTDKVFTNTYTNVSYVALCLLPANVTYAGDFIFQYESTGYDIREFVAEDYLLNSTTQNVTLYLAGVGNTTDITVHVVDSQDVDLEGYIVRAQRFNISNNQYYTVDYEFTDSDGNAVLNLITGDNFYRFTILNDGEALLTTSRFKLTETSYEYVIGDQVETPAYWWLVRQGLADTLTWTNSTNTFTFAWSDENNAIASQYCLNISYVNGTSVNSECTTTDIGSLTHTISDTTAHYVAQSFATFEGTDELLDTISVNLGGFWRTFGANASLMMAIIIIATFGLIAAIAGPKGLVLGTLAGFITTYFFGLLPISISALISLGVVAFSLIYLMRGGRE